MDYGTVVNRSMSPLHHVIIYFSQGSISSYFFMKLGLLCDLDWLRSRRYKGDAFEFGPIVRPYGSVGPELETLERNGITS